MREKRAGGGGGGWEGGTGVPRADSEKEERGEGGGGERTEGGVENRGGEVGSASVTCACKTNT